MYLWVSKHRVAISNQAGGQRGGQVGVEGRRAAWWVGGMPVDLSQAGAVGWQPLGTLLTATEAAGLSARTVTWVSRALALTGGRY